MAEVRFFVTGEGGGEGYYRESPRHKPCRGGGVLGIRPQKIFKFGSSEMLFFSTCHEICLRKIDLEYETRTQLQVTFIKMTESKENKSIQRLDVPGSTGPGGGGGGGWLPPCLPSNCGFISTG